MRWTRGDACDKQAPVWLENRQDGRDVTAGLAKLCFGCNSRSKTAEA
jgi:hypothetical protein